MKRMIAVLLCVLLCWGACAVAESAEDELFIFEDAAPKTKTKTTTAEIFYVVARKLNVRTGPDEFFPVTHKLKKYAKVYVIGEDGTWWKIWDSGEIGYVNKAYLKATGKRETIEWPEDNPF